MSDNNQIPSNKSYRKKRNIVIFSILIIIILSTYFIVSNFSRNLIKKYQQKAIEKIELSTLRKIDIGEIKYSFNSTEFKNIKISEKSSKKDFLNSDNIKIEYDPYIIISTKKIIIKKVEINKMQIYFKKENDKWNFEDILNLLGEDKRPFYQKYTIEQLNINNSQILLKSTENEFFLSNINSEIVHIIGTATFFVKSNFNLTASIKNIPIVSNIKTDLKTMFFEKNNEFSGAFELKDVFVDKISVPILKLEVDYKKATKLKIKAETQQLVGFSKYEKFLEFEKNYTRIFGKKFPNSIQKLELELLLNKEEFYINIKSDLINIKSKINFNEKKHLFELKLFEIKAISNSEIFSPKLSSNSSETINKIIINLIKEIENFSLILKEVL